ncbi:hypothetical protein [Paraburkholderia sp. D1E]|uniref:hypothetical protein n=1 Tax=Paraburkholderia sp. D1E TaxID=3461398 RepID=UPI004045F6B9
MDAKLAERRGLTPLGAYRGMVVADCSPQESGIGPVFAIPKLLKQHGLTIDDIRIWERNEAFASQLLCCRGRLGVPNELLNVSGGAISAGHPYGMTVARTTGHLLIAGRRRSAKYGVVAMCVGDGMGAAGRFEIFQYSARRIVPTVTGLCCAWGWPKSDLFGFINGERSMRSALLWIPELPEEMSC